jgi:hypothetical protein
MASIGRARDHGIVLKRAHFAITMAEFLVHRMLAGEQAQLGAMKAPLEQVIDRRLELLRAMEDSNGFTNGTDLLLKGHSGTLHLNVPVVGICGGESDAGTCPVSTRHALGTFRADIAYEQGACRRFTVD